MRKIALFYALTLLLSTPFHWLAATAALTAVIVVRHWTAPKPTTA